MKIYMIMLLLAVLCGSSGCRRGRFKEITMDEIRENRTVRIDVTTNGWMSIHSYCFKKDSMKEFLSERFERSGQCPVVVCGESGCTFETLLPVVTLCEEVGMQAIALRLTDLPIDQLSIGEDDPQPPRYWHFKYEWTGSRSFKKY